MNQPINLDFPVTKHRVQSTVIPEGWNPKNPNTWFKRLNKDVNEMYGVVPVKSWVGNKMKVA